MNWQTGRISGTKEVAGAKLYAVAEIPEKAKDLIAAELSGLPDGSLVTIAGYSSDVSDARHPEHKTRNIQISISSTAP